MRDTNLHYKDCNEMHSGSCSQMASSCRCPIREESDHMKNSTLNNLIRISVGGPCVEEFDFDEAADKGACMRNSRIKVTEPSATFIRES